MNPCNKHHDQYHTECDAGYSCYLCRIAELEAEIKRRDELIDYKERQIMKERKRRIKAEKAALREDK